MLFMEKSLKIKQYFIETYGCQMNKYDSELVANLLEQMGYQAAQTPAEADILLVNTCSVREHAETRALGRLTALNEFKLKRPGVVLGVLGCMAQRIGKQILDEKPFVNLALGPDSYRQLPDLIRQLVANPAAQQQDETDVSDYEDYSNLYPSRIQGVSAWVAIMRGCNNFCAYCIVPYLRGRERSRRLENILTEVRQLAADGFKEVTLLGQNVNSYHDGEFDFPDLLAQVSDTPGIARVRFASSHPKDLSPKLIDTISARDNICKHIHLAVQSGSNHVLQQMNRYYTREHYLALLENSRKKIPEISFTTDIIVGFPGETERHFEELLDFVAEQRFDRLGAFPYSAEESTPAEHMADQVSEGIKAERLDRLMSLQQEIAFERNNSLIGHTVDVIIDSVEDNGTGIGRTPADCPDIDQEVFVTESSVAVGDLCRVCITGVVGYDLTGTKLEDGCS